uniref:Cyclin N-terminal domain-containing protein n=1 Tax=Kalanchoe fedtschenkoi TaxID=63787 RepID=A0A7N0ZVR7_KALFE
MESGDQDPGSAGSVSTLLCAESPAFLHDDGDDRVQETAFDQEFSHLRDDLGPQDDEYVSTLLERENGCELGAPGNEQKRWMKCARLESIEWVMRNRASLGFRYRTAYLAIMYFDRYLSLGMTMKKRKKWVIRLLTMACLSLAVKMEEVRIPAMREYTADSAAFSFGNDSIKKMELMVLNGLQWEMGLATPLCFMHFFTRKFEALTAAAVDGGGGVVARTAGFIFTALKVASTVAYRPSVVAAAAALAAVDQNLTKEALESKINSSPVTNFGFYATDYVHSCYELMKKLEPDHRLQIQSPKPLAKSPDTSSQGPGSSSASSGVDNKRRRLSFDGCGQNGSTMPPSPK